MKLMVPASLVSKYKLQFRKVVSLFYRGQTYECLICNFRMSSFINLKNGDKLCPKCGSLGRSRRLWKQIENQIQGKSILHFSPSSGIANQIQQTQEVSYITSDFEEEFEANESYDIRSIPLQNEAFDMIICYHILEHIIEDLEAMAELYRILKFNGICYIQSPFKEGKIAEDNSITDPTDRLIAFGQEDHVRVYSVKGLKHRLEDVGFYVEILTFNSNKMNRYGFTEKETLLKAIKRSI